MSLTQRAARVGHDGRSTRNMKIIIPILYLCALGLALAVESDQATRPILKIEILPGTRKDWAYDMRISNPTNSVVSYAGYSRQPTNITRYVAEYLKEGKWDNPYTEIGCGSGNGIWKVNPKSSDLYGFTLSNLAEYKNEKSEFIFRIKVCVYPGTPEQWLKDISKEYVPSGEGAAYSKPYICKNGKIEPAG